MTILVYFNNGRNAIFLTMIEMLYFNNGRDAIF